MIGVLLAFPAMARDEGHHANSPLKGWFEGLGSGRGLCCSFADGVSIADVDWTIEGEGQRCRIFDDDAESHRTGHYCVRLEGSWWLVPDIAVVLDPNRFGPAVVWPTYIENKARPDDKPTLVGIRCFLPGALT